MRGSQREQGEPLPTILISSNTCTLVVVVPVPMMPFGSGKLTKSGALPAWGVCSTRKQEMGRRREGRREERKKGEKEGWKGGGKRVGEERRRRGGRS